jgi:uncharacterized SAM-dependent methyltransferase
VGMLYFFLCCVGWLLIFSQKESRSFLKIINKDLGGQFNLDSFAHRAFYNEKKEKNRNVPYIKG